MSPYLQGIIHTILPRTYVDARVCAASGYEKWMHICLSTRIPVKTRQFLKEPGNVVAFPGRKSSVMELHGSWSVCSLDKVVFYE